MGRTMIWALVCTAIFSWAGDRFTQEQLNARFYYDLGSAEVDISSYPKKQQANYALFKKTCSQCHTLARPINASIIARKDWARYVRRMHLHSKTWRGTSCTEQEAKVIVDFLAFDSKKRKVGQESVFKAKTEELKTLFKEVQVERLRLKAKEDESKVRAQPPYTGVK